MKKWLSTILLGLCLIGCSNSSRGPTIQSFSPIMIDLSKIDQNDFSEVVSIVNSTYAEGKDAFGDARVLKEESNFTYIMVYSLSTDGACYRVSIDRNRSRIVNMQPNCSIAIE